MPYKMAINGFGRIGRPTLKIALDNPDVDVVAINDLTDNATLAHLLKYDSVYGIYDKEVKATEGTITIGGKEIRALSEPDPAKLPWKELGVDVVIESTGVFRKEKDVKKHLDAGAKIVIISAPAKEGNINTFVKGVNDQDMNDSDKIIDNASCTTNCIAPVMEILERHFGVEKSMMTTIHSYTADQVLVDGPHKDLRRGRAAALNMIPTSTGAAKATGKTVPAVEGKFDGLSIRVPTPVGSLADITALLKKDATPEEINEIFKEEASSDRYKGILEVTEEPLVLTDVIKNPNSSIVDLSLTSVVGGNLAKIISWYDNEWGYSNRLVEQSVDLAKIILK